jgi:predicted nucleic acid-binding protein
MSVPKSLFIDTSIFDQQNYNFGSSAVLPFLAAAEGKGIRLLLPDPTLREVRRHIAERADNVVRALEDARRKAPFLEKSKKWPIPTGFALSWELRQLAMDEWKQFLRHFHVEELSYEGVSLAEIMNWYDKQHPPFGPKKSKEFPDALAIASLLTFARKEGEPIAVISHDGDFKSACHRFAELLYFPSLPALTEALIASDDRVKKIKALLEAKTDVLVDAIREDFLTLHFYPAADTSGEADDVAVHEIEFQDVRVVGVGVQECTISFEARVAYSASVKYDDPDRAVVDSPEDLYMRSARYRYRGSVDDEAVVSGIAKVEMNPEWNDFGKIEFFRLEESEIEVQARPRREMD